MIERTALRVAALAVAAGVVAACGSEDATSPPTASASAPEGTTRTSSAAAPTDPVDAPATAAPSPADTTDPGSVPAQGQSADRPDPPLTAGTVCGTGFNGLGYVAIDLDCDTATTVQGAYGDHLVAGGSTSTTVTVDGTEWQCAQLSGEINPYLQCSNAAGGTVRLFS